MGHKYANIFAQQGEWPDTMGHPREYFQRHGCVLDCRGPLVIDATALVGLCVMIVTQSHDISNWPELGPIVKRPVTIDAHAWIGSRSLLCGCHIGEGAIVAAGTVLRSQNVAPYTMVAGDPARVIARWQGGAWAYVDGAAEAFPRELV